MKKMRKSMLLATCVVSSLGLAACGNNDDDKYNRAWQHADYNYVIVDYSDNKPDVLYEIKSYYFTGDGYGTGHTYSKLAFTTKVDNKEFAIDGDWYMFEEKPPRAFYDVEYGTKEWNDLLNNDENTADL